MLVSVSATIEQIHVTQEPNVSLSFNNVKDVSVESETDLVTQVSLSPAFIRRLQKNTQDDRAKLEELIPASIQEANDTGLLQATNRCSLAGVWCPCTISCPSFVCEEQQPFGDPAVTVSIKILRTSSSTEFGSSPTESNETGEFKHGPMPDKKDNSGYSNIAGHYVAQISTSVLHASTQDEPHTCTIIFAHKHRNDHDDANTITFQPLIPISSQVVAPATTAFSVNAVIRFTVNDLLPAIQAPFEAAPANRKSVSYGCLSIPDLYRHVAYFHGIGGFAKNEKVVQSIAAPAEYRCETQAAHISKFVRHCLGLEGQLFDKSEQISLKNKRILNSGVVQLLRNDREETVGFSSLRSLDGTFGRCKARWELLRSLDLSSVIVGDTGLLPVLSVLHCCRGVEHFAVDRNSLSLASATPLFLVLSRHPAISSVSLCGNHFYESAGEELLRTIKVNRRIMLFDMSANDLSPSLFKRFQSQLDRNAVEANSNVFNPFAGPYAMLRSASDIPDSSWALALSIWTLLTAKLGKANTDENMKDPMDSTVPPLAAAPLLTAVIARAYRSIVHSIDDSIVRQLFKPLAVQNASEPSTNSSSSESSDSCSSDFQWVAGTLAAFQLAADVRLPAGVTMTVAPRKPTSEFHLNTVAEYTYPCSVLKTFLLPFEVMRSTPHRWNDAARALRCLGHAQYQLGIRRRHYPLIHRAWFEAVSHEMGPETFHRDAQAAWLQVTALFLRAAHLD